MRSRRLGAVLAALLVLAALPPVGAAQSRLRIVGTLPDLYVITKALVADAAAVDVVARFGQNPHDMEVC